MAAPTQEIRTIVVDDSPAALKAICSIVARQSGLIFVGAAMNGREALTLARNSRPDLALLDLEMPVMDGFEALFWLRAQCPATRVIIVTIHDTAAMRRLCSERGACGFIAKGALGEELPGLIRTLFGNGKLSS